MKPTPPPEVERCRINGPALRCIGAFNVRGLRIIASNGAGWDHVSVSLPDRCPTWDDMEYVRKLFFKPDETVMQLHVPESDHINNHPYCLHLWRPQTSDEIQIIKADWGDEWPREYPVKSPGKIPRPPQVFV